MFSAEGLLGAQIQGFEQGVVGLPVAGPPIGVFTLFRLPLEEDFPHPDDLADEVWVTVVHELAHHLGIDDERLHELGVD